MLVILAILVLGFSSGFVDVCKDKQPCCWNGQGECVDFSKEILWTFSAFPGEGRSLNAIFEGDMTDGMCLTPCRYTFDDQSPPTEPRCKGESSLNPQVNCKYDADFRRSFTQSDPALVVDDVWSMTQTIPNGEGQTCDRKRFFGSASYEYLSKEYPIVQTDDYEKMKIELSTCKIAPVDDVTGINWVYDCGTIECDMYTFKKHYGENSSVLTKEMSFQADGNGGASGYLYMSASPDILFSGMEVKWSEKDHFRFLIQPIQMQGNNLQSVFITTRGEKLENYDISGKITYDVSTIYTESEQSDTSEYEAGYTISEHMEKNVFRMISNFIVFPISEKSEASKFLKHGATIGAGTPFGGVVSFPQSNHTEYIVVNSTVLPTLSLMLENGKIVPGDGHGYNFQMLTEDDPNFWSGMDKRLRTCTRFPTFPRFCYFSEKMKFLHRF